MAIDSKNPRLMTNFSLKGFHDLATCADIAIARNAPRVEVFVTAPQVPQRAEQASAETTEDLRAQGARKEEEARA